MGGLALAGHYLKAMAPQWGRLDAVLPMRSGVSNSDIVRANRGLLVQGKSDFDAIEDYRGNKFFKKALGTGGWPTLRQRLGAQAAALFKHIPGINERLLGSQRPDKGCWRAAGCRWTWTPLR